MKKYVLSIMVALFGFMPTSWAQDDDVYFIPSEPKEEPRNEEVQYPSARTTANDDHFAHDNWADQRSMNGRDIDEYNRRSKGERDTEEMTVSEQEERNMQEISCTERIV